MKSFCESDNLTNPIKQPTCFEPLPKKPSFIDLILTNRPKFCETTCVIESDFHKMTVSIPEMHF